MPRSLPPLAVLLLAGCGTTPADPAPTEPHLDAAQRFRGLGVQALPERWPTGSAPDATRVESFSARDARLQDVLVAMFKDSDVNLILAPSVGERVATFDIKGASLEEALEALLSTYDLDCRWNGTFLHVSPTARRVYEVDFPASNDVNGGMGAMGGAAMTSTTGNSSGQGVNATSGAGAGSAMAAAAFWQALRSDLTQLTENAETRVVTNPNLGTVIAEGPPSALRRIEAYLDAARRRATRLVSIEARILEVSLNDSLNVGVNWTLFPDFFNTAEGGGAADGGIISQRLSSAAEALRFGLIKTDTFSLLVDALEQQGQVRVLSNPRISTLNNVPAQIRVVEQVPVIEREIVDSQGTSRTQFSVRFEDAGVTVLVTPQIGEDGMITVHVQPTITEVSGFVSTPDNLATEPILNTRSTEGIVRVADGQAAVIGGLRGSRTTEDLDKVPFLGDLPLLGALFRTTTQSRSQTELVIVLFPRVLTPAWIDEDVERGIERVVEARVPYRRISLGLEEPREAWRRAALDGAPGQGDLGHGRIAVAAPAEASAKGISRQGLARLAFGRALRALAKQDEVLADAELDEALQLDDTLADAWLLRGTLERRRNGNAAARAAYQRALSLSRDDGFALNNLGLLELNAENPVAAEGLFQRALQSAGDQFAAAHNNLGVARLQQGDLVGARRAFEQALAIDASLREARANLAVTLDRQGEVAGAAEAYRQFLLSGGDLHDPRLRALRTRIATLTGSR